VTLPNLLVIGATKAGTTTLWHYLDQHPQVYMAPDKELHYFDVDANWLRGLSWYEDKFAAAGNEPVIGEATPGYTRYPLRPWAAARAATAVPDAKLIYLVRDPIERIRSHVVHEMRHGREQRPFTEAVLANSMYVDASCYAMQAQRWLGSYPREALLIVESERLHTATEETMRQIYEFLDVDAGFTPAAAHLNNSSTALQSSAWAQQLRQRTGVPALTAMTPRIVRQRVKDHIRRREHANALHADVPSWLRERLTQTLAPDVEDLAQLMPAGFQGWGMLPPAVSVRLPRDVSEPVASSS
jgi:hypothetical protein